MPHRPPVLLILGLFLFLNPIVASSALIGRGELGGDSLWGLDDAFSAGAAGLGTLLDFVTGPGTIDTPSGSPSEQLDESPSPSPEGPDQEGSLPFESTAMKKCAAEEENQVGQLGGSDVEQSWWQVEQEPETGYVAPKTKYYGDDCLLQSRSMARRNGKKKCNTDLGLYAGDL